MNYFNTFIAVAPDSKAQQGTAPQRKQDKPSIASIQYELVAHQPYQLTQQEVLFAVHVQRTAVTEETQHISRDVLWANFFSKSMACMRTSPLAKTYGWGLHFNEEGKLALVAVESPLYQTLLHDRHLTQTYAMRSKRG